MNAIILAAGMGTRLRPLTNDRPKCLVEVNGVPIVEKQIIYLKEIGIDDITLVTGYKTDALNYLKERYSVKSVFNEKYDVFNNLYSMLKVLDRFGDSYVVEGDVYMNSNCFKSEIKHSSYFAKREEYHNEWGLITDKNNNLVNVKIGDGIGFFMSGISYWTQKDAVIITKEILRLVSEGSNNLFWDNAVLNVLDRMQIKVEEVTNLYEIDTIGDLKTLEDALKEKQ